MTGGASPAVLLSIGGSDPSSGAGIQGDIRTLAGLGAYCTTVITALSAQNTAKYHSTYEIPAESVAAQLESVLSDVDVSGIKISMVHDAKIMDVIRAGVSGMDIPILLDPVMISTTGGRLLKKDALGPLGNILLPIATVVTPNIHELAVLSGKTIASLDDLDDAAASLMKQGAGDIIATGFCRNSDAASDTVSDVVFAGGKRKILDTKRVSVENHGGGGAHSSAVLFGITSGMNTVDAAVFAQRQARSLAKYSVDAGRGAPITGDAAAEIKELHDAISEFLRLDGAAGIIPECQTNFVHSKGAACDIMDVIGVRGRIVRAGAQVILAGTLEYGGSRHVASALVAFQKIFPETRSAINLRYNPDILKRCREKFSVAFYDRHSEPKDTKSEEGRSIAWGIGEALRSGAHPDAVCHRGDMGKEPMIIVFGATPADVLSKVRRILE